MEETDFYSKKSLYEKKFILMRQCLGKISSSNDFRELSHAIASIRQKKENPSRYEQLVLLREINNKIKLFV